MQELRDAGGDPVVLGGLARSSDRGALLEALRALGFTKLGQRLRIEKALLEDPTQIVGVLGAAPGQTMDAAAVESTDSTAFWDNIAQASADVLGAEGAAGGGNCGHGEAACDYAAHAAAVAAEASATRRRQAAADEARAEVAAQAAAERAASSTWEAGSGLRPSVRAGFLNEADLNVVRGASGVAMAPHAGGVREARAEAAAVTAAATRRNVAARAQGMAFLMPGGGRARGAEDASGGGDGGGGGGAGGRGGVGSGDVLEGSLGDCVECSGGDGQCGGGGGSGGAAGGGGETAAARVARAAARDNPLGHVGSGVAEHMRNQSGMGVVPSSLRVRPK